MFLTFIYNCLMVCYIHHVWWVTFYARVDNYFLHYWVDCLFVGFQSCFFGYDIFEEIGCIIIIWEDWYHDNAIRYSRYDTRNQNWAQILPPEFNNRIWDISCVCINGSMFWISNHPAHVCNFKNIVVEYNICEDRFSSFHCPVTNAGKFFKIVNVDEAVGLLVQDVWDGCNMNIALWVFDSTVAMFNWRIHHVFFCLLSNLNVIGFNHSVYRPISVNFVYRKIYMMETINYRLF